MKPLLDTDTVSLMLRGNASVTVRVGNYRRTEGPVAVSVIVLYEVLRGLKFLDAKLQMASFQSFMRANEVIHLDEAIAQTAADLYATLRKQGQLLPDADLLIAATALDRGYILVTRNLKHFERIPNLQLENWVD